LRAGPAVGRADHAAGPKRSAGENPAAQSPGKITVVSRARAIGEKQYAKAALFGGAEIFCLAQVLIFISKGNNAYNKYRAAIDYEAAVEFRARTEKYDRRRNTAILAAAGVWVLNMIDMFVFAKKKYGKKNLNRFPAILQP